MRWYHELEVRQHTSRMEPNSKPQVGPTGPGMKSSPSSVSRVPACARSDVTGTGYYVWFRVTFDTQYVLWLSLILMMFDVWFQLSFDTQYVWWLSLILITLMFWFRVSSDRQYVIFILSRDSLILDMFYEIFQSYGFGSPYCYCLQVSGQLDKCI